MSIDIARQMISKGILAADESVGTMNKRLESIKAEPSEANRQKWREILAATPNISKHVSAVILSDDIVQKDIHEKFVAKGIVPGIKVDKGAKTLANFPREKVTEGLDGLRERLNEYSQMGLKFAKWRAVLTVIPSVACVQANAHALARYAALVQEAGMVPIVEPEVLMDGAHDIEVAREATEAALHATFDGLHWQGVDLRAIVLKPNMVMYGYNKDGHHQEEVVKATLETLYKCVPASVPGIAFLSGGQPDMDAVAHLRLMNLQKRPWRLTFSYGRALQGSALRKWGGKPENEDAAKQELLNRAYACHEASLGRMVNVVPLNDA